MQPPPAVNTAADNTTAPQRPARRLLLLGWDAADWRMIDPLLEQGKMPNLKALIERGVRGNIASLQPMLSPMLWNSIATGKTADQHNILGFAEPDGDTGKTRPVTSSSRKAKALWNILSRAGLKSVVINWFASHPAEHIEGTVVTDRYAHAGESPSSWEGVTGSVHPQNLQASIDAARLHPLQVKMEAVKRLIPNTDKIDPYSREVQSLRRMLARYISLLDAARIALTETEWDFAALYFEEIDRFGHEFMDFHPPRRPGVDEQAFEAYQHIMNGIYELHDIVLGQQLKIAGQDTTVIILSDHGFQSDDARPDGSARIDAGSPVDWHRPYGIFVAAGPGIEKDAPLFGMSLLDVAPTILALLGQPVPKDMRGTVQTQILTEDAQSFQSVDTYENDGPPNDAPSQEEDPWTVREMMRQLSALGYVEDASMDSVVHSRGSALATVLSSTGQPEQAVEQLKGMLEDYPGDANVRFQLFGCLLMVGDVDKAEHMLDELDSDHQAGTLRCVLQPESEPALEISDDRFVMGRVQIAITRKQYSQARELLTSMPESQLTSANMQMMLGQLAARENDWEGSKKHYSAVLDIEQEQADAWDGLGVAQRALGQKADAINSHMHAVSLDQHRANSHLCLGIALVELGNLEWAERAFEQVLQLKPDEKLAADGIEFIRQAKTNTQRPSNSSNNNDSIDNTE